MTTRRIPAVLLLVAAVVFAPSARAAFNAYLRLGDIKGESTDAQHKDWIEIDSYQFDSIHSAAMGSVARGARSGRVNVQELTITKKVDKTSPKLMEAAASGKPFQNATIDLRRAGESQDFLVIKMENVLVTNVQPGRGTGPVPTETMSLNYSKIEWTYTKQKPDGTAFRNPTAEREALAAGAAGQPTPVPTPHRLDVESGAALNSALRCCRITGATAAAPFLGQTVTLTITSSTACSDAFVDWGDGSIAEGHALTSTSTTLPAHTYATPGVKTIKVGGSDASYWPNLPQKKPSRSPNPCTGQAPLVNVTLRSAASQPMQRALPGSTPPPPR